MRYVRIDRRIYDFSLCKRCGAAGFCGPEGCAETTCMWCGTAQCMANGGGNGQCSICHHGLLPGWSGSTGHTCAYKGCGKPAVGRFPRKGYCCAEHGARILGADYLPAALANRAKHWVLVA